MLLFFFSLSHISRGACSLSDTLPCSCISHFFFPLNFTTLSSAYPYVCRARRPAYSPRSLVLTSTEYVSLHFLTKKRQCCTSPSVTSNGEAIFGCPKGYQLRYFVTRFIRLSSPLGDFLSHVTTWPFGNNIILIMYLFYKVKTWNSTI